ncbi:MAG: hypothetical protein RLZZ468_804 [Cyanobacteriota bacterium]|jgi:hypothetical protein
MTVKSPPTITWGHAKVFDAAPDVTIWGAEFQLLPADGTMARPAEILGGVLGHRCRRVSSSQIELLDASTVLLGTRGTPTDALREHQEAIMRSFQAVTGGGGQLEPFEA